MTRNLTFGVVVVALLVAASGLAGAAAVTDASPAASDSATLAQETTTTDDAATDNESSESNATINFDEQSSNGTAVVVNGTTLSEGGFVVIYAENGTVIGNSSYLEPGEHENVTVELDVTLDRTQVLVGVAHADTNGDQRFDFNVSEAEAAATTAENTTAETTTQIEVTDGPYMEGGLPVTDVAFIRVRDDTARGDGTETETESEHRTAPLR